MDLNIATHQARAYKVATPVYEGPLDLLLQLIEQTKEFDRGGLGILEISVTYFDFKYCPHRSVGESMTRSIFVIIHTSVPILRI